MTLGFQAPRRHARDDNESTEGLAPPPGTCARCLARHATVYVPESELLSEGRDARRKSVGP